MEDCRLLTKVDMESCPYARSQIQCYGDACRTVWPLQCSEHIINVRYGVVLYKAVDVIIYQMRNAYFWIYSEYVVPVVFCTELSFVYL